MLHALAGRLVRGHPHELAKGARGFHEQVREIRRLDPDLHFTGMLLERVRCHRIRWVQRACLAHRVLVLRNVVSVRFLGTGPAGGRPGRGRSRRMESSLLVSTERSAILIDATRDYAQQSRWIDHVDLVLLTHAHRDASGGLAMLDRSLDKTVPVVASRATIRSLQARHPRLVHVELQALRSLETFAWHGWRSTPLVVPHARDCTTFAWRVARAGVSIVYASDVARVTRALASFCDGCDLLVLDGAMWRRRIFTHLEIRSTISLVARWPVRRVLLTQIGRSPPTHAELDRWLHAVDPRFGAAYDGLEVELAG